VNDPDGDLSVIPVLNPDIAIAPSLLATSDSSNERIGAVHWSSIDAACGSAAIESAVEGEPAAPAVWLDGLGSLSY
jgi:hypothetical protein